VPSIKPIEFLTTLNPAQLQASQAPLGPCLVLAGPGTGKTRTLLARLLYLINHCQIPPQQILAVTYTNKAKGEMQARLQSLLPNQAGQIFISTFHTFCLHILRQHHQQLELPRYFSIADENRQLHILANVAQQIGKPLSPRQQKEFLGRLSQARLDPQAPSLTSLLQQLRHGYQQQLQKEQLLDFDDILFKVQQLFFENPPILNNYRQQFTAILVDEFQDTDRVQYEIIKQLAVPHYNIFAVADDDQSIFAWRGAHPQNIQQFRQDFPQCTIASLTANYRSHPEIIRQAQIVLAPLSSTKLIIPTISELENRSENNNVVQVRASLDDEEQAEFIIRTITAQLAANKNLTYQDFAVLYARHTLGSQLEQLLMKAQIPCQLVRGRSLLDHTKIQRALALLQVLHNSKDRYHLQKFIDQEVGQEISTRIKKFQLEDNSSDFLATLTKFSRSREIPETEREKVSQTIALVNNFLYLPKNQPQLRFSQLFDQILNSLRDQNTTGLLNYLDQLSDPRDFPDITAAAKQLYEAQQHKRPVLVLAQIPAWEFVAQQILHRALAVKTISLPELLDAPSDTTPLVIMLDGLAPNRLLTLSIPHQDPIYLGQEYTPEIRQQLQQLAALVINPEQVTTFERGTEPSVIALLFKICQAVMAMEATNLLVDYIALDIETTDLEVSSCDIIHLAAVKVHNGQPIARFDNLIKPEQTITLAASMVHQITEENVQSAPEFRTVAPRFLDFIAQETLVAHNGTGFDFPCLKRHLKKLGLSLPNDQYDTLPFAKQLYPEKSLKLDNLAAHFGIPRPTYHNALEDTQALVQIFEQLKLQYNLRLRKTSGQSVLDWVAAGMILEQQKQASLSAIFIQEGLPRLRASYIWELLQQREIEVTLLKQYLSESTIKSPPLKTVDSDHSPDLAQILEIVQSFDHPQDPRQDHPQDPHQPWDLATAIREFLDFITLYQQSDAQQQRNAVNLMTIYAAKGLEFAQVFVIGLEDGVLPNYQALKTLPSNQNNPPNNLPNSLNNQDSEKLAEQRRLLYVAITRAKQHLYLMHVQQRNHRPQQLSHFLTVTSEEAENL
jgi:DNA polymerase III epsilon subunit family exonuclease